MIVISEPIEFQWDEGNSHNNKDKHRVEKTEAEDVFSDKNKIIFSDTFHSDTEKRYIVLGKTSKRRLLYIIFTLRNGNIRIISARDINKKEVYLYKKKLVLPKFKNEDEEREFWLKLDLSEYFEPDDFVPVSFPNLKPTSRPISIKIPEYLLNHVKEKAHSMNIPYQALIKKYIHDGVFPKS